MVEEVGMCVKFRCRKLGEVLSSARTYPAFV